MSETIVKSQESQIMALDRDNKCGDDLVKSEVSDDVKSEVLVKEEGAERNTSHRENRLTTIIDHLRCQSKMKGR